jgi:hypothetical protein
VVASVGAVVRGTVLLVEHEGPVRAYLEQQLADDGFEVLAAERGVQALDLAEEVKPDLVLLDAVLPDWVDADVEVFTRRKIPAPGVRIAVTQVRSVSRSASLTGYPRAVRTSLAPGERDDVVTIKPRALSGPAGSSFLLLDVEPGAAGPSPTEPLAPGGDRLACARHGDLAIIAVNLVEAAVGVDVARGVAGRIVQLDG